MYEPARILAGQLRLSGIYQSLERRCGEALAQGLHPAEVVRLLLEDERLSRQNAHAKRLTVQARFRTQCDLDGWDMSTPRGITKAKLKELAAGYFFEKKQNLIIRGATGVGKTHLAIAIGHLLCGRGISVAFHSTHLLFENLQAERVAGRFLQAISRLRKVQVLILDDFGLRNYTHEEATALLEILEDRYSKGSVIITSQVESEGWRSLFQDTVISDAIIDRLVNPSDAVLLSGESFRKRRKAN
jgi:DNA replication protein DnaC